MDQRFLREICDGYLTKHGAYQVALENSTQKDNTIVTKMQDNIINEINTVIKEIYEDDIEIYHMFHDKSKTFQKDIVETYLNYTYSKEEVLDEVVISTVALGAGALIGIASFIFGKTLTRVAFKTLSGIGKTFENMGKFLIKSGRTWKFKYAILQKNSVTCYKKCGVDPRDISPLAYAQVGADSSRISSQKAVKQADCLTECYVSWLMEVISLMSQAYFTCLKKTGASESLKDANSNEIMNVLAGLKLSGACDNYYKNLKDSYDNFYDLLDMVYKKDGGLKQSKIKELDDKIFKSKQKILRDNNSNRRRY